MKLAMKTTYNSIFAAVFFKQKMTNMDMVRATLFLISGAVMSILWIWRNQDMKPAKGQKSDNKSCIYTTKIYEMT